MTIVQNKIIVSDVRSTKLEINLRRPFLARSFCHDDNNNSNTVYYI